MPLEDQLGRHRVGRLERKPRFGIPHLERQGSHAAPAPLCLPSLALMRQEVLQAGEQERAELARRRMDSGQRVAFEEATEELLREILRLRCAHALPADEGVQRIPVVGAQAIQRLPARRVVRVARLQDDRPAGGVKPEGRGGRFCRRHAHKRCGGSLSQKTRLATAGLGGRRTGLDARLDGLTPGPRHRPGAQVANPIRAVGADVRRRCRPGAIPFASSRRRLQSVAVPCRAEKYPG